jgi:hypothetical protein
MAAQESVRLVVTAGVELRADPALVNEWTWTIVVFEQLNTIAAHCEQTVTVDQEPLRPPPAKAGGDNFIRIEHTVVIVVRQSPHGIAVPDQQTAPAIEAQIVTAT